MLKGKHIIISLLIIGLLWLNWFIYTTFKSLSNEQLSGDEGIVGFCIFITAMQSIVLLAIIGMNIDKLWKWEFNLNKWLCKLKH